MRRGGYPLMMGGGMGMGMGMGMGSPLLTGIMGYMLGRGSSQNTVQQVAQPVPAYPPQYAPAAPAQAAGVDDARLSQLKLLGQLHDSGTLTDEEFATEKQKILGGA